VSALVVLGITAGAVGLDAFAIFLALVFAHDRARPLGVVEKSAVVIHLVLVAAVAAIGTSVRWQPVIVWLVVVMILWLLVTFYAPIFRCVTRQTTGLGAAIGFSFATMAFSFVMGFAAGLIAAAAPEPGPGANAATAVALSLFALGFITMLLGGLLVNIPDREPESPTPRPAPPARPVGSARTASAGPARSSTPPAEPTPTRSAVYTNAAAHNAMARTPCSACRSIGYDVETYVFGSPHSWYLGRCPRCGHSRDFEFRTDD
jgi:hypothetical protein